MIRGILSQTVESALADCVSALSIILDEEVLLKSKLILRLKAQGIKLYKNGKSTKNIK
jgi:hypothetical protein